MINQESLLEKTGNNYRECFKSALNDLDITPQTPSGGGHTQTRASDVGNGGLIVTNKLNSLTPPKRIKTIETNEMNDNNGKSKIQERG